MSTSNQCLFKIVVIGDHCSGKSCILLRFSENSFRPDHVSTIGIDFKLRTIQLGVDRIRMELWDTAGMERYRTIYNSYYYYAHGVVIVYDITSRRSFTNVRDYWLNEVRSNAPPTAVLMLVGNKCDLGDERKVQFDEAERLASEMNVSLFEVSAKTGINVEDAFRELARCMRDRMLSWKLAPSADPAPADLDGGELETDEMRSAGFHIDGVVSKHTGVGWSCCMGGGSGGTGKATSFV